jgi:hypothetical protein
MAMSSGRNTYLNHLLSVDLIESELSGLAFDSLQCVFRPKDIATMYEQPPLPLGFSETIYIMIDPAAVRSPRLK